MATAVREAEVGTGWEELARGIYLEGLAADEHGGVWYSDVIRGGVYGHAPDGTRTIFNPERQWTGGVMLNADGCVLSSGEGGIMWNDPAGDAAGWLVNATDGVPLNGVNEMVPDADGGIYFGTVDLERILAGQPTRPATLYHLAIDGTLREVSAGLGFVNGMALAADGRTLFYNATFDGVHAFDVAADGTLAGHRRLLAKPDCDGMAIDRAGNLWVTGYKSAAITRLAPDGLLLDPVATPAGAVTQARFGGADGRDLYLTCVPAEAGDELAEGRLPSADRSVLLRGRTAVAGAVMATARFRLPA